jgi:beta-glucosidase
MITFPNDFLWGAATAAHQVEGGNNLNDWWRWEQSGGTAPSGTACDQYHRYKEDFDIVKSIGHNCHRFSVEWSRVQPEAGLFSDEALAHYRDMADQLRSRGIEQSLLCTILQIHSGSSTAAGGSLKTLPRFSPRMFPG